MVNTPNISAACKVSRAHPMSKKPSDKLIARFRDINGEGLTVQDGPIVSTPNIPAGELFAFCEREEDDRRMIIDRRLLATHTIIISFRTLMYPRRLLPHIREYTSHLTQNTFHLHIVPRHQFSYLSLTPIQRCMRKFSGASFSRIFTSWYVLAVMQPLTQQNIISAIRLSRLTIASSPSKSLKKRPQRCRKECEQSEEG